MSDSKNKRKIKKVQHFIQDPVYRFLVLARKGYCNFMSDEEYLKSMFHAKMGYELNLENPQTFNEKLQWLKLHDRNPEYTRMVDKYEVKQYVANIIGEEHIIPTLGIWDNFDEINFEKLPNQFVLKCTHDSGGIVICKDKENFELVKAKKKINNHLQRNFFYIGREWPYKDVKPRIIAEQYLTDEFGGELKDYKIFNFPGHPQIIEVDFDQFVDHKRNFYNTDWEYIDLALNYPTDPQHFISKPQALDKMLELAGKLAEGIPHVLTDLYCIDDKVYFGELTFYHEAGFGKFTPESYDLEFGSWIELPGVNSTLL